MNRKRTIRKGIILAAWLVVGGGLTTLLVAANRRESVRLCKEVLITVKGMGEKAYIDKDDIAVLLQKAAESKIRNTPVGSFDLARMEASLEKNPWIKDAELYLDSEEALHVVVLERQPVARVFTTAGTSFHLDTAGVRMPLLESVAVRVPVVTNFTNARRLVAKDSLQLAGVQAIARYVGEHPFWNAQIAQIDIVEKGQFELIPTIGSHVIRIGNAENIEEKPDRLYIFYRQVMSKTGFDKYSVLDVQFKDQVVAVHKGTSASVDSAQLQKNIGELLQKNRLLADSETEAMQGAKTAAPAKTEQTDKEKVAPDPTPEKPETAKPVTERRTAAPEQSGPKKGAREEQKPKAVMGPQGNGKRTQP